MILFTILMLLNATLTNDVLFAYRLDVGIFPLNLLDGLLAIVFLKQLVAPPRNAFQADRTHPLFTWSIGLLVVSIFIGILGATLGGTPMRQYVTALRNLTVLPVSIFIGYTLLSTPRSVRTITYIWVVSSVVSALALLFLVRERADTLGIGQSFDQLRLIRYGGDSGLAAAGLLAFAWVARVRLFPRMISAALLLVSTLGLFSPPHRTAYVTGVCTLLFSTLVLPKVPWSRRLGMTTVGIVLIGATLLAGAAVVSQATGRDFKAYVIDKRLKALIPAFDDETKSAVTASRLPGILVELKVWSESPLIGKGFAISARVESEVGEMGMNHNVWTAALAQYGPIGLLGFVVPIIGSITVGYRMWRDQTHRDMAILGVLAAIVGFVAFLWASLSLSINQQRLAMLVGIMFGFAFRCRAMQLTLLGQGQEYVEPSGDESRDWYDAPHPV